MKPEDAEGVKGRTSTGRVASRTQTQMLESTGTRTITTDAFDNHTSESDFTLESYRRFGRDTSVAFTVV